MSTKKRLSLPEDVELVLSKYRTLVDTQLRRFLTQAEHHARLEPLSTFYGQMRYHLGWVHPDFTPAEGTVGKYLRPTLLLLAHQACLPDDIHLEEQPPYQLEQILPAAVAIELVHNFSLVHDDIEDSDPLRRHRPTLWKLWGKSQAINTGDGLFFLARLALWELAAGGICNQLMLTLGHLLDSACLHLCEGQHLDMTFEHRREVPVILYLDMISRKTAALMRCATEMGARLATTDVAQVAQMALFGHTLGLAFQIRDDLLGIWATEQELGKESAGDLRRKKMSLPILEALEHGTAAQQARLCQIYEEEGPMSDEHIAEVLTIFASAGIRQHCQERLAAALRDARQALMVLKWYKSGSSARQELNSLLDFLEQGI